MLLFGFDGFEQVEDKHLDLRIICSYGNRPSFKQMFGFGEFEEVDDKYLDLRMILIY